MIIVRLPGNGTLEVTVLCHKIDFSEKYGKID